MFYKHDPSSALRAPSPTRGEGFVSHGLLTNWNYLMIGRLRGTLLEKSPPHLLIDVQGLAYELQASMFSFYRLPAVGQEVMLHTHLIVREDAHLLYGFFEIQERALFRRLLKVSGVGPK